MDLDIKVSVLVFSFNQEAFIFKALKGILDQKVNFKYEIIISDDGSTDGTMEIVQEFNRKHPEKFIILESKKNGLLHNTMRVLPFVRGEYIAFLDGDDFWVNENKLQNQTDFLDKNLEYNAVFHDAQIQHSGDADKYFFNLKKTYSQIYNYQTELFPADILNRTILPTASVVTRANILKEIDIEQIKDQFSIDWKVFCLIIRNSKFFYVNEPWTVYRNHNLGVSKSYNFDANESHIHFLKELLKDEFYKKYKYEIHHAITHELLLMIQSKKEISFWKRERLFLRYYCSEIKRVYYLKRNKNF